MSADEPRRSACCVDDPMTYEALVDTYYSVHSKYRDNAMWLGRAEMYSVLEELEDNAGCSLTRPSLEPDEPNRLLGRPFFVVPALPVGLLVFVGTY